MTTLSNFVASLRPEWGRDSMLDDLNTTIVEIENTTIPMCETVTRSMVGPFRSKEMVDNKYYKRKCKWMEFLSFIRK